MANKARSKQVKEEEVLLTEEEVWDVITYARNQSGGIYGTSYLNPELVSGRMRDVTLNPLQATQDMLDTAMKDPKSHESQLQSFSQSFELSSMVYKRLLAFLANILAFDITYTSTAEAKDYTTAKYKKDVKAVEDFLEKFNYKRELRVAVKEMLRNDAYFACFRDLGDDYVLQELPSEYCKITGRWGKGFLFSFNMYWFLQPGVDIDMYPPFFKKKYNEIWKKHGSTQNYFPSLPPEMRAGSSWIYWVDIPSTVGVCFKLSPEIATRLPYFSPLFSDLILQTLMRNLQKNMNMAAASKMILGEVPLLNRDIKATVKDSIAISPDLLGKFMALVKNSITDAIKVASAPLQNFKDISFETDNDLYDSYLRTTYGMSGINTNLIFSSNIKPNAIETQLSLNVDEQMMTVLYDQFEPFMNYVMNKNTKTFKFFCAFEGTEFYLNRQQRLDKAMKLFDKGVMLPQKIAASLGMKPAQFRKHMEESGATDFMSLLTPPALEAQKEMLELQGEQTEKLTAIQGEQAEKLASTKSLGQTKTSSNSESAGRPKKPDSELGEEGVSTRTEGTNLGRGGKE